MNLYYPTFLIGLPKELLRPLHYEKNYKSVESNPWMNNLKPCKPA